MSPQKTGDFEFKLGRFGLMVFTFGISLLLLFSFIFGVIVGKHIESYPEKIAKGIPKAIKETITKGVVDEEADVETSEKEDFELTFYDTLSKKREEEIPGVSEKRSDTRGAAGASEIKKPETTERYLVQVASFKDEERMKGLTTRLSSMGYTTRVDKVSLRSSGNWFRVKLVGFNSFDEAATAATVVEKKIGGLKCLVTKYKK